MMTMTASMECEQPCCGLVLILLVQMAWALHLVKPAAMSQRFSPEPVDLQLASQKLLFYVFTPCTGYYEQENTY